MEKEAVIADHDSLSSKDCRALSSISFHTHISYSKHIRCPYIYLGFHLEDDVDIRRNKKRKGESKILNGLSAAKGSNDTIALLLDWLIRQAIAQQSQIIFGECIHMWKPSGSDKDGNSGE